MSKKQPPISATYDSSTMARLSNVVYPGRNVMLGRGGESNYHSGNLNFRRVAETYKARYKKASKLEKPLIAAEVVAAWRNMDPPGRFLIRTDPSRTDSAWHDVGEALAIKRATKTLGERPQRERRAERAAKLKQQLSNAKLKASSPPPSPQSAYAAQPRRSDSSFSDNESASHISESNTVSLPESWRDASPGTQSRVLLNSLLHGNMQELTSASLQSQATEGGDQWRVGLGSLLAEAPSSGVFLPSAQGDTSFKQHLNSQVISSYQDQSSDSSVSSDGQSTTSSPHHAFFPEPRVAFGPAQEENKDEGAAHQVSSQFVNLPLFGIQPAVAQPASTLAAPLAQVQSTSFAGQAGNRTTKSPVQQHVSPLTTTSADLGRTLPTAAFLAENAFEDEDDGKPIARESL